MKFSLPKLGKEPVSLPHFPTRQQAFLFRAWEYVSAERIAKVLKTDEETVKRAAKAMGLPDYAPGEAWLKRGRITMIRRMWHILPYEQLMELLGVDEQELAAMMREEDFLDVKLRAKPVCEPVVWRELSEEEKKQTEELKRQMQTVDVSGKRPFDFHYETPALRFEGRERFATRMIYAFSGLYQNAFDVDSEEFLPDEQLKAYQALGVNGIWTQGVLSRIAPFPFEPSLSEGYEKRVERMRAMAERLGRYGIKLYLYLNEPRSMPPAFFEKHPELRGHDTVKEFCLCTSTPQVRDYLKDAVEAVCRNVPQLGGIFTITRSENLTNCYSKAGKSCNCPRCKERSVAEVIAETVACFAEGAHRVSPDIKVFAWSWAWEDYNEEIIRRLPKDVILLSQSELHMPFDIGGVQGKVIDYSMSIVGPGERAKREWEIARDCGLEIGAKVQINTTWEASTVPAIPVAPSVDAHVRRLEQEGVRHLLLSWTLGGYPGANVAAAARRFYEKCTSEPIDERHWRAQEQFVEAFREFPFHLNVLYHGPQNAGPSTLLFEEPTGYEATMTCFAYDDLEHWRHRYTEDAFEEQFRRLCEKWEQGLAILEENDVSETAVMAKAAYAIFRSCLNQIRFIRARNAGRYAEAARAAEEELAITETMLSLMNQNAAIGYEAANHYYFSKGQLAEKILNCHYVIRVFREKAGK